MTLTIVAPTAPRTISLPNATDTLVGKATADTLTNKTLTAPVIASIVNTGTLTLPTSTDTLVGKATTDVLTNKTLTAAALTSPVITTGTVAADPVTALGIASKQYIDAWLVLKDAQTATVDVQNTVTETNLYSVSIPQNTLTAGRKLSFVLWGDRLENAAGTLTLKLYLGATTLFTTGALDQTDSASRTWLYFYCDLFSIATNSQIAIGRYGYFSAGVVTIGSTLTQGSVTVNEAYGENTSTEDNGAGALTFRMTAQWSVASASLSARALGVKTQVFG